MTSLDRFSALYSIGSTEGILKIKDNKTRIRRYSSQSSSPAKGMWGDPKVGRVNFEFFLLHKLYELLSYKAYNVVGVLAQILEGGVKTVFSYVGREPRKWFGMEAYFFRQSLFDNIFGQDEVCEKLKATVIQYNIDPFSIGVIIA